MTKRERTWKCAVYVGASSWSKRRQGEETPPQAELLKKVRRAIARKADIEIAAEILEEPGCGSDGPGFDALCRMVVDRRVDCVAVPDGAMFAGNSPHMRFWVRDVLAPAGVRFFDASRRFDSNSCALEPYLARMAVEARGRSYRKCGERGKRRG